MKFLGIPYAEPPVGELRFQPPVGKSPHAGVLPTVRTGNICPQDEHAFHFFNFTDDTDANWSMNEDCLYMNVYVPTKSDGILPEKGSLPVMFWIHSGGWSWGSKMELGRRFGTVLGNDQLHPEPKIDFLAPGALQTG